MDFKKIEQHIEELYSSHDPGHWKVGDSIRLLLDVAETADSGDKDAVDDALMSLKEHLK